jgi:hypothetical protein
MSYTPRLKNHSTIDDNITSTIKNMIDEKGKTCVSIIVPTHRLGQDRQADHRAVQEAVTAAKQAILNESNDYLSAIDDLFQQIDFTRNKEGIGIFVSPNIRKLVRFPFPVIRKITVDKFFLLHDLLYVENYSTAYYVLDISKKKIHLFRGMMDHLEEINDQNFPQKITDNYEYSKPSQSSSDAGYAHVKSFEKDKSEIDLIRLKKAFREADKKFSEYLPKKTPLLLCGSKRTVSLFAAITNHESNIITSIGDNFSGTELHDLELLAWLQLRSYIDNQKLSLVEEFKEKIGAGLAVYKIEEVSKAAIEGRGFILLVEKDYNTYLNDKHGKYPDAVNKIITTVLEKNGRVIVLENDSLKDYKGIALITRY